ncbi:MAG: tetratricopeptide repeat protein [Chloroflexota bacterium]|nr:tetratricopeptide repeat protein [Chloroflexota bacterium]
MIQRFLIFLGPARARGLFILIAATGLLSLILNVVRDAGDWVALVQTGLALMALVGAAVIIGGRMDPQERGRWLGVLIPALGAIALGLTVLPQYLGVLVGGAFGWVVVGLFIFRSRAPEGLKQAVKHFRRNQYAEAVKELDQIIKDDPQNPNHYRFRGEVLRVWGKLDRARRDYLKMTELAPESPLAFNGLSEVQLQMGDLRGALASAHNAAALAPGDWVALYNLGMIADRLGESRQAIEHLDKALALKVNDSRHRALIHFYLARAHARLNDMTAAVAALDQLKRHRAGLEEWERIVNSDQASTLRDILGADIEQAGKLASGEIELAALSQTKAALR